MTGAPGFQRALIAFECFLVHVVDTTYATLAAAIGGVRLGRAARRGIGRIVVRQRGFAGIHDMLSQECIAGIRRAGPFPGFDK